MQPAKKQMKPFKSRSITPPAIAQPVRRRNSKKDEMKQHVMLTAHSNNNTARGGPFCPLIRPSVSASAAGRNPRSKAAAGEFVPGLFIGLHRCWEAIGKTRIIPAERIQFSIRPDDVRAA